MGTRGHSWGWPSWPKTGQKWAKFQIVMKMKEKNYCSSGVNVWFDLEQIATKGFLMEMGSTIIGLSNQKKLPQNFPLEGPRRGPRSIPGGPWGVNFKKKFFERGVHWNQRVLICLDPLCLRNLHKKNLWKFLISESLERAKVIFANFEHKQLAEKTPNELYMNF